MSLLNVTLSTFNRSLLVGTNIITIGLALCMIWGKDWIGLMECFVFLGAYNAFMKASRTDHETILEGEDL